MDETHLSLLPSVSNRARGKLSRNSISSVARYTLSTQLLFFSLKPWSKDGMTFMLHDCTDFYVEVTALCIKVNYHSCFHNCLLNSKSKIK